MARERRVVPFSPAELDNLRNAVAKVEEIHQFLRGWVNEGYNFDAQTPRRQVQLYVSLKLRLTPFSTHLGWAMSLLVPATSRLDSSDTVTQWLIAAVTKGHDCNSMMGHGSHIIEEWHAALDPTQLDIVSWHLWAATP